MNFFNEVYLKYKYLEKWLLQTHLAENGFDPLTSGLWAQHAPAAPLCFPTMEQQIVCTISYVWLRNIYHEDDGLCPTVESQTLYHIFHIRSVLYFPVSVCVRGQEEVTHWIHLMTLMCKWNGPSSISSVIFPKGSKSLLTWHVDIVMSEFNLAVREKSRK